MGIFILLLMLAFCIPSDADREVVKFKTNIIIVIVIILAIYFAISNNYN